MRILLFIKAPLPGTVKTRLASGVGDEEALRIYRLLVEHQLRNLPENAEVEIHFTPAEQADLMRDWLGSDRILIPQTGGDLGDRLAHAVRAAFADGAERVACIGGDCPGLDAELFERAERKLRAGSDAVYGPTPDGGYYLLAVKAYHPALFRNIPWSSTKTLQTSLRAAKALNLRVELLETREDVDYQADWRRAQALHDFTP